MTMEPDQASEEIHIDPAASLIDPICFGKDFSFLVRYSIRSFSDRDGRNDLISAVIYNAHRIIKHVGYVKKFTLIICYYAMSTPSHHNRRYHALGL